LALKRWDSPPEQHPIEGNILEWVRRRLRESPAAAYDSFRELPLPYRRVFAARRLEAEVLEGGFEGFFNSLYSKLAPDAMEALRAFGADEHARSLAQAMEGRTLWLQSRRRRAIEEASLAFHEAEVRTSLMSLRARYIAGEADAFRPLT
jgi:hypothetical protein